MPVAIPRGVQLALAVAVAFVASNCLGLRGNV